MYKKICNIIIVYFAVISLIFTALQVSFAQEMAPEAVPKALEELPAEPAEKETTPGNVTIDFKDADILNVLRILSIKSGVNIVAGKDVEGTVTIRLVNVPWKKALDVVLKTYGFAYEQEANIIRVATVESLGQELKTRVFRLEYAKSYTVEEKRDKEGLVIREKTPGLDESIKEMLSERGSVKSDKRTNTLVVTDTPAKIHEIEEVIAKLDEPTPQVYIEAKIIETTLDDDEKLGIDWTVQATATGSTIPTTLPLHRGLAHIPYLLDSSIPVVSGTDTPSFPADPASITLGDTTGVWTFGTLNFSSFQAVLYMLNTRADTKIISNPRLVTLNNQKATIHIGDTYYTPRWSESTITGAPTFTGVEETKMKVGITLKVTPHVNTKNEIVVELEPEVSSLGAKDALLTTTEGYTVYTWPVSKRTARTQIMVKDGETIAIGGLLKETTIKTRNKIPILGDIPILGHLFRYSADTIDTRDLLIFVTVKLIESKKDTEPMFKDVTERMDEFEHASTTMGHQWEPDTPIGSGEKKKKTLKLLVD